MAWDRELRILFVCTANVCRSPMAAGFMTRHASTTGVDLAVSSASVDSEVRPRHPLTRTMLADRGVAISADHSNPLTEQLTDWADLIVTMTGGHAISVAGRFRSARPKVFVLDHFAQIVDSPGTEATVEHWLAVVYQQARSYPAHPGVEDIADPMGKDEARFRAIADQIDGLVGQVVASLDG